MSKVLVRIFTTVFIGALFYEVLDRTNPGVTKRLKEKISEGLDGILAPAQKKA
jgi:hypothetical protein